MLPLLWIEINKLPKAMLSGVLLPIKGKWNLFPYFCGLNSADETVFAIRIRTSAYIWA